MRLTWKCISSWAIDQEVLDPMNFQRQFFRTEIAPWNGKEQLSDALQHVYLPTYGRTLDIGKQKKAHQHYIQLPDPYSAVFAATSKLMGRFMKSQYWTQRVSLPPPSPHLMVLLWPCFFPSLPVQKFGGYMFYFTF